ncbi:MAG TPA: MarR family transcriptional regulator [Lacisediminihabitans sp.]|uniref:MarR family winged helix-turn-helix transcriptional regulator n=1 Tax=Lacisediminihabitans sp. TaxID=2787631 RepID=UPI002ED7E4BC
MDERDANGAGIATAAMAGELRALIGRLNRRLREEARPGDFTPSQVSALGRLVESDLTLTSLARAEGMRPQSMRAIVAVLEAAGLVVGAPDPSDGRQVILSLSAEARETIEANRVAKEDWLFRTIQAKLSAGEQEQLASSIELMKRLLDP